MWCIIKMNKGIIIGVVLGSLALLAGGFFLASKPSSPSPAKGDIVSTNGLHWHPHLTIRTKDKQEKIPKNIGISSVHYPVHTHDSTGTLHLEFGGTVTKDEIKLKEFFKIWGKRFYRECIFDKCKGPEGKVKFFVNGKENKEFENYIMRDKDQIEILYE